jgi:hypothetical protein
LQFDCRSFVTVTVSWLAPTVTVVGETLTENAWFPPVSRWHGATLVPVLEGATPDGLVAVLAPPLHAAAATVKPRPTTKATRDRHVILTLLSFIERVLTSVLHGTRGKDRTCLVNR